MALLDKVHRLRDVVRRHYTALAARFAGREVLSPEEQAAIASMEFPEEDPVVADAYHFGHSDEDQQTFVEHQEAAAVRQLGEVEHEGLRIARHQAAEHIRAQGDRLAQQFGQILYDGAHAERVREAVATAQAGSPSTRRLAAELRRTTGDMRKNWDLVAVTELHNARQHARIDRIRREHGTSARVYKIVAANACPYCVDLHIGPDGVPRIFSLDDLDSSNVGRKKAAWEAVVGSTHPGCQCEIFRLPDGWGFDEEGTPRPDGSYGVTYEKSKYDREFDLRKNLRTKETVNYNGLEIAIEQRKGDVRKWTDKSGRKGQTVMNYAYGYVKNTEGADGDGYDCFVGPVPDAPFVYIIHQQQEDADRYDEDKAMIGFSNAHHAKRAYLAHFDDPSFYGSMSMVPFEEFIQKLTEMRPGGRVDNDGMLKATSPQSSVRLVAKSNQVRHSGPTDNPTPPQYPAGPTLAPHYGAWTSQAGDRAVREGSSGPNILFHAPQPYVERHPETQRQKIAEHVAARAEDADRRREQRWRIMEGTVAQKLRSAAEPTTHLAIRPYQVWEERAKIDAAVRDTIPDKREWVERKLVERNLLRQNTPHRMSAQQARFYIRPELLDTAPAVVELTEPLPDAQQTEAARAMGVHRAPKTTVGKEHQPQPQRVKSKQQTTEQTTEQETTKSVTVKKRGVGDVTLAWSADSYQVTIPGRGQREFTSLSRACDYVWVLTKGFSSVESYRTATGRQKVPSGAGWKFWGLDRGRS